MEKRLGYLILSLFLTTSCFGQYQRGRLLIEEIDGDPSKRFKTLKVSNGSLTDNGDGTGSLNTPFSSIVYINSVDDLPDAVGGKITLVVNTVYIARLGNTLTLTDELVFPAGRIRLEDFRISTNKQITITGGGSGSNNFVNFSLTFTGNNPSAIVCSDLGAVNSIRFLRGSITATPTMKIFDIDSSSSLFSFFILDNVTTGLSGQLGTLDTVSFISHNCQFINFSDGFEFIDNADGITFSGTTGFSAGQNSVGSIFIDISGTIGQATIAGLQAVPKSNETVFDFDSGLTFNGINVSSGIISLTEASVDYSNVFASGSLDQTTLKVNFSNCNPVPDSTVLGSLYMERNEISTEIIAKGVNAVITAFADAGGGNTTVLTGTTPTNGTIVWIVNDDYCGKYTTSNTVLNTSFDIVKAFSGTDTGTWENNWVKVAGITFPLENERASMTDNNELTFTNLEETPVSVTVSTNPQNDGIAAAKDWEFTVLKNDCRLKGSLKFREMTNKAAEGILETETTVIAGDVFSVYTRNLSDTTTDQIMSNMTMRISK